VLVFEPPFGRPQCLQRSPPCPSQATFTLVVDAPRGTTVLSNGVAAATGSLNDSWVRHAFEPSPLMSTYLVAVAAGQLVAQTTATSRWGHTGLPPPLLKCVLAG